MTFFTDLDNTMIYSYKKDIGEHKICVEMYQGREVSYMTKYSYDLLNKLQSKINIIPVTTRTIEQYERINLGIRVPKYALVCNGGVLLKNGTEEVLWYEQSLALIKAAHEALKEAQLLLEKDSDRSFEVRNIRDLFIFTKSLAPEQTVKRLKERLDLTRVEVQQNGIKIYVLPINLSKGHAVRRLMESFCDDFNTKETISAGDSLFDIPMLLETKKAFSAKSIAEDLKILRQEDYKTSVICENDKEIFSDTILKNLYQVY